MVVSAILLQTNDILQSVSVSEGYVTRPWQQTKENVIKHDSKFHKTCAPLTIKTDQYMR